MLPYKSQVTSVDYSLDSLGGGCNGHLVKGSGGLCVLAPVASVGFSVQYYTDKADRGKMTRTTEATLKQNGNLIASPTAVKNRKFTINDRFRSLAPFFGWILLYSDKGPRPLTGVRRGRRSPLRIGQSLTVSPTRPCSRRPQARPRVPQPLSVTERNWPPLGARLAIAHTGLALFSQTLILPPGPIGAPASTSSENKGLSQHTMSASPL